MRYARQGANTLKYFLIGTSFQFLFILFGILAMLLFEVLHINNKNGNCGFIVLSAHVLRFYRSCLFVFTTLYSSLGSIGHYSLRHNVHPIFFFLLAPCLHFLVLRTRQADGRRNFSLISQCVYNLFIVEIYKLHDASTIIMALLVSSRLEVLRRIFAVIFLVIVYSLSHNRHG